MCYTLSVSGGTPSGNTWTLPTEQSIATLTVTAIQDGIAESPEEMIELTFAGDNLPTGRTVTETTRTITIAENQWAGFIIRQRTIANPCRCCS